MNSSIELIRSSIIIPIITYNKLILATHNEHKAEEFKQILAQFRVQTLADLNYDQEITETASDLEGNSLLKADTIFRQYGHIVISDDSGLEVQALNGAPGVYSARYAGEQKNDQKNTEKLLHELKGITNRNAQFRTVITLMSSNVLFNLKGLLKAQSYMNPKVTRALVMTCFYPQWISKNICRTLIK